MTGLSTNAIHAADHLKRVPDVIPPINVSTTFRYSSNPDELVKAADNKDNIDDTPIYSRLAHPGSNSVEALLGPIVKGHSVVYNSGLSAFFAALTLFNPRTIAIGKGYHGCHGIVDIFKRNQGLVQIGLDDDFSVLQKGDIVHLETPVNPDGTYFDISYYAEKAHKYGALLMVDSTFAPPPLQDPFQHGADIVMHSATKYFGGHSDLLAGVLVTQDREIKNQLLNDRVFLGSNIGNLESALLIRSLKTLELRVLQQSRSATRIVEYLSQNIGQFPDLVEIVHGSLQKDSYIATQVTAHTPVFSIKVKSEDFAKRLPSKLNFFEHATSLGGVESLIEWRALSDATVAPDILRISIGVENSDDLLNDLIQALSQ